MKINLHIAFPEGAARSVEYRSAVIGIGRDPTCELALDGGDGTKAASWRHARIEIGAKGAYLIDLNSSNGTFLNGRRASGRERLQPGDQIGIGQSGPKLTVTRLDLSIPDAEPVPATLQQAAKLAPRSASPPREPSAAAAGPSETRMLLMQLRHRHTNWFKWAGIGAGGVAAIIAVILLINSMRISEVADDTGKIRDELARHEAFMKRLGDSVKDVQGAVVINTRNLDKLSQDVRGIAGTLGDLENNQEKSNRMLEALARDIPGIKDAIKSLQSRPTATQPRRPAAPPIAENPVRLGWKGPQRAVVWFRDDKQLRELQRGHWIVDLESFNTSDRRVLLRCLRDKIETDMYHYIKDDVYYGRSGGLIKVKYERIDVAPRSFVDSDIRGIRTSSNYFVFNQLQKSFEPFFTHYDFQKADGADPALWRVSVNQAESGSRPVERVFATFHMADGRQLPGLLAVSGAVHHSISLASNISELEAKQIQKITTPVNPNIVMYYDKKNDEYTSERPWTETEKLLKALAGLWATEALSDGPAKELIQKWILEKTIYRDS